MSTSGEADTSVFDPVLFELVYRWFSPPGGVTLDPFAGGSVRGVVGAKLGRRYVGVDLRKEQVDANRKQAGELLSESEPAPVWHCGDSRNIRSLAAGVEADFVMTCPPYADLEVYSDDPRDLSTMKYADFVSAYREIIAGACSMLKRDRFACIVVGEVRSKSGGYLKQWGRRCTERHEEAPGCRTDGQGRSGRQERREQKGGGGAAWHKQGDARKKCRADQGQHLGTSAPRRVQDPRAAAGLESEGRLRKT